VNHNKSAPFVWDMVRYCMELPYGGLRHFPAGSYNEQMKTISGIIELQLMDRVHAVWYAFKHLSMRQWGKNELKLSKWMMTTKIPEKPTRRLDSLIFRLWPYSWWLNMVIRDMREGENDESH
jgi:hypothetical protein